jgi:catechol 2,3-dioxygenase-like lactoylglutathione lyase family enzyme
VHHIEINVSDLHRSVEFWNWLLIELGYKPFQQWDLGKSWKLASTYLVLVQTEASHIPAGYHRKHTGLNHLAFHAASRDQVDKITAELHKRGYEILYPDRHPFAGGQNYYAVFFEDPDRIKVEIVAPRPNRTPTSNLPASTEDRKEAG